MDYVGYDLLVVMRLLLTVVGVFMLVLVCDSFV